MTSHSPAGTLQLDDLTMNSAAALVASHHTAGTLRLDDLGNGNTAKLYVVKNGDISKHGAFLSLASSQPLSNHPP
jgi:hypothetical protein